MDEYVVQAGDTLITIAATQLRDATRWTEIAHVNSLQNPNRLLVGQRLNLPARSFGALGDGATDTVRIANVHARAVTEPQRTRFASPATAFAQITPQIPASMAPARGYLFVLFEQLPDVGTEKIIRKVAAIPKDFSLQPNAIRGTLTLAEHVLNLNPLASQYVSASDRSHGAPSIEGKPLLIDVKKAHLAGAHVYSVQEVVADLRRLAAEQPGTRPRVEKLVWAIENIEGEVLIKGAVERQAITTVSSAHQPYISSAEDLWRAFQEKTITKPQLESGLDALRGSYEKARIVGRVGRVLTVVGVILTVKDIADAADRCVTERSLKPLSAEAVRQVGGWGGAAVGGKIGFGLGAVFGIETGPGAIVTGALGAIVFGALGYFGSDLIADQISPH